MQQIRDRILHRMMENEFNDTYSREHLLLSLLLWYSYAINIMTDEEDANVENAFATEITDLGRPELDVYARLSEVQLLRYDEPEPGIFIAESPKVIERACNAGYQPLSFLVERRDLAGEGGRSWSGIRRCRSIPRTMRFW